MKKEIAEVIYNYIPDIIEEQEHLNSAYDLNWRATYSPSKFSLAAIDEIKEIKDELSSFCNFFGKAEKENFHLALEETVDVIHFYATRVIVESPDSDLTPYACDVETKSVSEWVRLMAAICTAPQANTIRLAQIIYMACNIFDVTPDLMLVAYLHKNRKNHKRAAAGAISQDVKHIKQSELSTFEFLRSESWISLTQEMFNAKLAATLK